MLVKMESNSNSGGSFSEKDLWINEQGTAIGDTTVPLYDSIDKYDYIRFDYKLKGHADVYSSIYPSAMAQEANGFTNQPVCGISGYYSSSPYIRFGVFSTLSSCHFTVPYQINGTSTGTNDTIIPMKVVGLK